VDERTPGGIRYINGATRSHDITRSDPRGRLGAVMSCLPGGPSRLPVAIMPTLKEVVARVVEGSPAG